MCSKKCVMTHGCCPACSAISTLLPPPRGLTTMVDTVNIEIQSWPEVVQQALGYLQTATVLVPLFGLLW